MGFEGLFGDKEDICREFQIADFSGVVIHACYEYEDYSGSAGVVFVDDGLIYTVSGSHCSCYGLEEQWDPCEMPLAALRRIEKDGWGNYATACTEAVKAINARVKLRKNASEASIRRALREAFG